MNYVKKMCILRQIQQGFSTDGKTLSGLIKMEQYGKNLAVEVSVINFAPLSQGEYYCLLSDGQGKTEMLGLRGKSFFNLLSDLDISHGFCGIVCYVKDDVVPIAYGINGNGQYDWRSILNATLPPVFPQNERKKGRNIGTEIAESMFLEPNHTQKTAQLPIEPPENTQNTPPMYATNEKTAVAAANAQAQADAMSIQNSSSVTYDDELVAQENYYTENNEYGQKLFQKTDCDAHTQSTTQSKDKKTRTNAQKDGNADDVRHPFETDTDGYYRAVKAEIDELFRSYPRDDTLNGAFSCGEWVRVKGSKDNPEYLVGVVYFNGKARYICYALAAQDKSNPPKEIASVCSFVPTAPFDEEKGFFVIFQSAATGECVKPQKS